MSRARQGIKLHAFTCSGLARVGQLTLADCKRLRGAIKDLAEDDQLRVEVEKFLSGPGLPGAKAGELLSEAIDHLNHVEVGDNIRRQTGE